MAQGISPNNLNKISEVYLSQISEHHKKDADGNTIPHEGEEVEEGAGLYANIHAKRKRGGKMRKKGDKGAPSSQDFANAARTAKEETEIGEAKVDTGRSDYGKASIRNYRRMGPGHDEPGMFDPEGKRGKAIDKRREEHKARRGVKGAKVPAYKVEGVEVDEAMKPSNMKKKAKLSAALKRLEDMKVASKMKEEVKRDEYGDPIGGPKISKKQLNKNLAKNEPDEDHTTTSAEGIQYGIFKGDGKPKGAMAAFGKKKKKEKKKVKMEALSNWKEDYVWEQDEEEMQKEVKEKKVKNKIIINPKLGEAVEELGGQLIDVQEMSHGDKEEDPQLKSKMLRQRQLKKQVLLRKLQAVRQTGGEDIVAHYEPEGEEVNEVIGGGSLIATGAVIGAGLALPKLMQAAKKAGQRLKQLNIKRMKPLQNEYEPEGEQLDEYGNPRVGIRLRAARAIDRVNPKPKVGSKRTAMSNALKMSAIKGETKRRQEKENPYSLGKKMKMVVRSMSEGETIDEEGYDIARDMGKVPPTKDKKDATTMPPSKEMMKMQKVNKGPSALDIVKADIRKKMGKDAIMDMGKK